MLKSKIKKKAVHSVNRFRGFCCITSMCCLWNCWKADFPFATMYLTLTTLNCMYFLLLLLLLLMLTKSSDHRYIYQQDNIHPPRRAIAGWILQGLAPGWVLQVQHCGVSNLRHYYILGCSDIVQRVKNLNEELFLTVGQHIANYYFQTAFTLFWVV